MAFVNPAIDESEENKFGPTGTTTPSPEAPPTDTGSTGSGSSIGGAGAAPTQATSTQFGSSASKLSDYLAANAPQIESMGSDIAGKFNTQYGQLQGDINKAGSDFGTAVSGGYAAANPELVGRAMSNPAGFVQNAGDVSAFQKQLNNAYTGPQNFESFAPYGKVQGDVSSAVQNAGLLGSSGGLSSYLKSKATGQYTPGMNTLDTTLLQANPNAQKMVTDATKQYGGLTDYLNQAAQAANAQVAPAQQAAEQSRLAAGTALTGKEKSFEDTLTDRLSGTQGSYDTYNTRLSNLLNSLNQTATQMPQNQPLDPRLRAALTGLGAYNQYNPAEAFSVPLSSTYLSPAKNIAPPSRGDVATPEDIAQGKALALLSGEGYQPSVSQAGNYQIPNLPTFNQSALGSSLYGLLSNGQTPNFTQATNPNSALAGYKLAKTNLSDYMGIPNPTGEPLVPPPAPPTTPPGPVISPQPPPQTYGGIPFTPDPNYPSPTPAPQTPEQSTLTYADYNRISSGGGTPEEKQYLDYLQNLPNGFIWKQSPVISSQPRPGVRKFFSRVLA
jgi:hypothetical protein